MTVWIVMDCAPYEGDTIVAVCGTEAAADEMLQELRAAQSELPYNTYEIESWEVQS